MSGIAKAVFWYGQLVLSLAAAVIVSDAIYEHGIYIHRVIVIGVLGAFGVLFGSFYLKLSYRAVGVITSSVAGAVFALWRIAFAFHLEQLGMSEIPLIATSVVLWVLAALLSVRRRHADH